MRQGGEKRGSSYDRRRRKQRLIQVYGNGESVRCVWCRRLLTYAAVQADRIIPAGPYAFWNVLPACGRCNLKRSDQGPWEFAVTAIRPTWLLLILKVPEATRRGA